jgi:hypothetical protein
VSLTASRTPARSLRPCSSAQRVQLSFGARAVPRYLRPRAASPWQQPSSPLRIQARAFSTPGTGLRPAKALDRAPGVEPATADPPAAERPGGAIPARRPLRL